MKNLIFMITFILSINVCAQNEFEITNVFVRVYDMQGKKIGKGKIISISETSFQLYRKGESVKVLISGIGSIKTKHSAGNNVLVGSAIGATTMAMLGAATAEPGALIYGYSAGEGAAAGVLLGGTAGAAIGGITILFKNSKSYEINGDIEKWKAFKKMIIN
jgi:hypothetical protein